MSEISLPEVRLPTVRMRKVKLPDITIPEIKPRGGRLAGLKIPDVKIPEIRMPDVKATELKIPEVKLSDHKAKDVQRAGQKAVEVNMPDVKVPDVKMPDIKIPDVRLSEIRLGDLKLSDALSGLSLPDVKVRNVPDRSDIVNKLPRREAPSPVPFIMVGAMTGILLGLWLATVAPTSSWIRMTADDLKIKFDRWRAGTADAVGERMDEYLAPTPGMDTSMKSSRTETAGLDRSTAPTSASATTPGVTGTTEQSEETASSY